MADDLIPVLTRFHREVLLPDVKRIMDEAVDELRAEMNAHFDAVYQRFDRLDEAHRVPDSGAQKDGDIRVVDESGEDYLYPAHWFVAVDVPKAVEESLLRAS